MKGWLIMESPAFEIAYAPEQEDLAKITLIYAEAAYFDLKKPATLDQSLRTKVRIYVSPNLWKHNEIAYEFPKGLLKNSPDLWQHKNVTYVYFTGDRLTFFQQIKYKLARLMLYEQFLGKPNLNFTNNLLMYVPEWFIDGAARFLAEGWSYQDEMLMQQLPSTNFEQMLLEPSNSPIFCTLRKSFWFFIAKEWKREKIAEIFYMTRLTRSIEGGLITVLGQTPRTITARWNAFCQAFYNSQEVSTEPLLNIRKNHKLLAWDVTDLLVAGLIAKNGRILPFTMMPPSKTIHFFANPVIDAYLPEDTWHSIPFRLNPTASKAAFENYLNGNITVSIIDLNAHKIQHIILNKPLDGVLDILWLNDKELILSAFVHGSTDIYRLSVESGKLQNLTLTAEQDETNPVRIGNQLYFVAPAIDSSQKTFTSLSVQNAKNLWVYDLSAQRAQRLTNDPLYDLIPLANHNDTLLVLDTRFLPSATTCYNAQNLKVQPPTSSFINLKTTSKSMFYTAFNRGKIHLFSQPIQLTMQAQMSDPRKFSAAFLWNQELKERAQKQQLDQILHQDTMTLDSLPEQKDKNNKVRYYVFDEGDTVKVTVNKRVKQQKKNPVPLEDLFFNVEKVQKMDNYAHTPALVLTKMRIAFTLDPIYRLGVTNQLYIKETRNQYDVFFEFTPFLKDFQSSFVHTYISRKLGKTTYFMGLEKRSAFFKEPFWVRYNTFTPYFQFKQALSLYENIQFTYQALHIVRHDIRLTDNTIFDAQAWNNNLVLTYRYLKTRSLHDFTFKGFDLKTSATYAMHFRDGRYNFLNYALDVKHYLPLTKKHTVLVNRFQASLSIGQYRPQFFMGGWNEWVNAEFLNKSELPVLDYVERFSYSRIIPMKGFSYNARNGTQYALWTAEMVIPVNRITKGALSGVPFYNLQFMAWATLGTIWTTGNPLSQKNPIDAKTIYRPPLTITVQSLKSPFIASLGLASQFYVMGYPLRVDFAFPIEDYNFTKPRLVFTLGYEL